MGFVGNDERDITSYRVIASHKQVKLLRGYDKNIYATV